MMLGFVIFVLGVGQRPTEKLNSYLSLIYSLFAMISMRLIAIIVNNTLGKLSKQRGML